MVTTSCKISDHFNAHGWAVQHDFVQMRDLEELRQVGLWNRPCELRLSCTVVRW